MWLGVRTSYFGYVVWMCFSNQLGVCSFNLALKKPAWMSSKHGSSKFEASNAVDGMSGINEEDLICSHSNQNDMAPWLVVDLMGLYYVSNVKIINRQSCCQERLTNFTIEVFKTNPSRCASAQGSVCMVYPGVFGSSETVVCNTPVLGRYVRISKPSVHLSLCEIEVYKGEQAYECDPITIPKVSGKRLISANVTSLSASSRKVCVVECRMFGACVGVNYNTGTGVCELLTRPEPSDTVSALQDWVYYGQDLC